MFARYASRNMLGGVAVATAAASGAFYLSSNTENTTTSFFTSPMNKSVAVCDAVKKAESIPNPLDALSSKEYLPFKLESKETISPNTHLYRFALPSEQHQTGLVVASCLMVRAEIDGKKVMRPYTPVSLNNQKGHLDLIVKSYPAPGGLMSRHLETLEAGDVIEMKGPFKKLTYEVGMKKNIGMIAGGTGITPCLQVIREILGNPFDHTEVSLVYANVTEKDILLRDELDALAYLYPNFKVYYTLDKPGSQWKGGKGFISEQMINDRIGEPSEDNLVFVCGPNGMMAHVSGNKGPKKTQGEVGGLLKKLGFTSDMVYKF